MEGIIIAVVCLADVVTRVCRGVCVQVYTCIHVYTGINMYKRKCIHVCYVYIHADCNMQIETCIHIILSCSVSPPYRHYGVAMVSRIDKIIGLFFTIASLL